MVRSGFTKGLRKKMNKRKWSGKTKAPPAKRARRAPLARTTSTRSLIEKKAWDLGSSGAGSVNLAQVNQSGSITSIFNPIPGSDMINRIGRRVNVKSIQIRGVMFFENAVNLATTVSSVAQCATWALVFDKQPNGALPGYTDIFNNANAPLSNLNLNNRDRFRILKRKVYTFDPFVTTATDLFFQKTTQKFECFTKLNLETTFNAGATGTITDINTGAFLLVFMGSAAAGTNTDLNASFTTRTRFTDP